MALILFLTGLIAIAWWAMPIIAQSWLTYLAHNAGWSLTRIDIPRQTLPPWHVPFVSASNEDTRITVQGAWISPPDADHPWRIRIKSIDIKSGSGATRSSLTVADLRKRLADQMPLPLAEGTIEQLDWCAESCQRGEVKWSTAANGFKVDGRLELSTPIDITAAMMDSDLRVSVNGSGLGATTNVNWPVDGNLAFDTLVSIDRNTDPLRFGGDKPLHFSASVHQASLRGKGTLPTDTPLLATAVMNRLTASLDAKIAADATLGIDKVEVSHQSGENISVQIQLQPGRQAVI